MAHIPTTLVPVRQGDHFLITTNQGYWGKGKTIDAARRALRGAGQIGSPEHWHVYSVDHTTVVEDDGSLNAPMDHKPIMVAKY